MGFGPAAGPPYTDGGRRLLVTWLNKPALMWVTLLELTQHGPPNGDAPVNAARFTYAGTIVRHGHYALSGETCRVFCTCEG